jgi:hypothetical protein
MTATELEEQMLALFVARCHTRLKKSAFYYAEIQTENQLQQNSL